MVSSRSLLQLSNVCAVATLSLLVLAALPPAESDSKQPSHQVSAADLAAVAEEVLKDAEPAVASPEAFRENAEEVTQKGYILALLANEVASAKGGAKWKGNALAVREAALELAKAGEAQNLSDASKALKRIHDLLSAGGTGPAEGVEKEPLEMVPLYNVMHEVQRRWLLLRRNVRRERLFTSKRQSIQRDAQLIAFLATVARTDTHTAKEIGKSQEGFEKNANEMLEAAKALAAACKQRDFTAAGTARKSLQAACSRCHLDYRPDLPL